METTFTEGDTGRSVLRDTLLSDSLLRSLQEMVPARIDRVSVVPRGDDTGPLDDLLRLGGLRRGRWAKTHLFVGLNGTAAAHAGRNLLICTRPLRDELTDFADRHGMTPDRGGDWVGHVLGNYASVLFLDRFHFGASAGFAPWIKPKLIDRFPVRLKSPMPARRAGGHPRVLLIDHRDPHTADGTLRPLTDIYARLEQVADLIQIDPAADPATRQACLDADLHLHHGFSNHRAAEVSPLDSMIAGIYTVVLAQKLPSGDSQLGDELAAIASERSYVMIAETRGTAVKAAENLLSRITMFATTNLPFNVEMQRSQRMNAAFLTQKTDLLKTFVSS